MSLDPSYRFGRIGLEAGPLSQWLFNALGEAGLPVICVETRHMRAALKIASVHWRHGCVIGSAATSVKPQSRVRRAEGAGLDGEGAGRAKICLSQDAASSDNVREIEYQFLQMRCVFSPTTCLWRRAPLSSAAIASRSRSNSSCRARPQAPEPRRAGSWPRPGPTLNPCPSIA